MKLLEFTMRFPDKESCELYLKQEREKAGVICSHSGGTHDKWDKYNKNMERKRNWRNKPLKLKKILNNIYYALSKIEHAVNLFNLKEGLTDNVMTVAIADYQFAFSLISTGVFCLIVMRFYFDYIIVIPLILLFITFYLSNVITTKYIWDGPDKELQQQCKEQDIDVILWSIAGICLGFFSLICVFVGGFCFIKGIESIWSYQ